MLLVLRGKHAQKARAKLVKTTDGFSVPLPSECGVASLRIVGEYKHLGSVIDNVGTALQDVPVRSSAAMAAPRTRLLLKRFFALFAFNVPLDCACSLH